MSVGRPFLDVTVGLERRTSLGISFPASRPKTKKGAEFGFGTPLKSPLHRPRKSLAGADARSAL